MTERFLGLLTLSRNDSGRFFGSLHSLRMTGYVTLSEQPPFVTLSEVEGSVMLSDQRESKHLDFSTMLEMTERFLGLLTLSRNDRLCHLERATTICHPERSRRVCHVKRPTGVETSRFLDYARNDSGGVFQNEKAVIFQILQFEGFAWWCKQFGSFHCVRLACF